MKALKARIRSLIYMATELRKAGDRWGAARCVDRAGELRRTLFYVYGNRS